MEFLAHLFMKIMEIRRKVGWKVNGWMWGGNWGKIMENEENRSLIHQEAYEDHLVTFCQFNFGTLFYSLSLSYSCTLRAFLDHAWSSLAFTRFGERRQRNVGSVREQVGQRLQLDCFASNMLHVWFSYWFMDAWYMHVVFWLCVVIGMEDFLDWQWF